MPEELDLGPEDHEILDRIWDEIVAEKEEERRRKTQTQPR
jgi:hypothetical protein